MNSMSQLTRPMRQAPPAIGLSIGQYLLRRLQDYGLGHVFGVPGDYILSFYSMLEESPIQAVGCTREDCAGYAADAYARINGMGAVCVTYCVGGLSVCNSVAGAFAEKSPVVVISGAPGLDERENNPLLHHKVREFDTQYEVFEKLCQAGAKLDDPLTAFREIDRVLSACARFKRPVYIELPRDMVSVVPAIAHTYHAEALASDPQAVAEATSEAAELLAAAKKPLIIVGVEIHRFGLQDQVLALAEKFEIPFAATILGKSAISETHPLCIGVYEGALGRDEVTQFVEESDCVLMLGTFMTDLNLGIYTAKLTPSQCILATSEQLAIRHHHYRGVLLGDFITDLTQRIEHVAPRPIPAELQRTPVEFIPQPESPITISRLITRLNQQLDNNTIVIADIGDSLFAGSELVIRGRTEFISPAYYTSMGFSVPAALGANTARPESRVVVICGDGAFQMTGMELSNIVRRGYNPIVLVLDNGGYGTERRLHSGQWEYNDIKGWNYSRLPEVLGGGTGYLVKTEGDFEQSLQAAWADTSGMSLLQICLDQNDFSQTILRLSERLSQRV